MKQLFNPTDNPTTVWFGHTPYFIGPNDYVEIEDLIADAAVKHPDYKHLQIRSLGGEEINEVIETEGGGLQDDYQGSKAEAGSEKVTEPWTVSGWDPLSASIDELRAYVVRFSLKIDSDASETLLRQIVDEHMFESHD